MISDKSYAHTITLIGCGTAFSESLDDHVYNEIQFLIRTVDYKSKKNVCSGVKRIFLLPPVKADFIRHSDVSESTIHGWISMYCDVVSIQKENLALLYDNISFEKNSGVSEP